MLDYASEDINGMDDDAGEEQAQSPPLTGHWTTTSSYHVYMVDTPKEGDGDEEKDPVEDEPPEIPPKHRRQRRRSKSHLEKDSNTGTGDNNTPEKCRRPRIPVEPTSEKDDWEEGQVNPDDPVENEVLEDSNSTDL